MKFMLVIALTTVVVLYTSTAYEATQRVLVDPENLLAFANCSENNFTVKGNGYILNQRTCGTHYPEEKFANVTVVVKLNDVEKERFYTFMVITCGPYLRWAVLNIPGTVLRGNGIIGRYNQTMAYERKTLYPFKGKPRRCYYRALLYKQTKKIIGAVTITEAERLPFNATEFAQKHDLLGPLAVTEAWLFFLSN